MELKKRELSYDVIRIVALLMIVMVHVSAYMVIFFPAVDRIEWLVGNIFNGISRAGVPMFILLSGALLLSEDKPLDTKRFYKRNLLTMVLLGAGWMTAYGLFYAVLLPVMEGEPVHLAAFWGYLTRFQGSEYPHLWYMLMVVGLYLMIPVLRLFVKRENRTYIVGIIVAALIIQFGARTADLLTLGCPTGVSELLAKLHLEPVTGFVGYLLIGWYLNEYRLRKGGRLALYVLGAASVVVSTLVVYRSIDRVPGIRDYMYSELSLMALVYGTALFVLLQSLCGHRRTRSRLTAALSDCTFGIYLFHVVVLEVVVRRLLPYERFGLGRPLAYIVILYLVVLLVSLVVVRLMGRIKVLRRMFFTGSR